MLKRKTIKEKACKVCGTVYPISSLSNKGQCYSCAKKRMLEMFDLMWKYQRE